MLRWIAGLAMGLAPLSGAAETAAPTRWTFDVPPDGRVTLTIDGRAVTAFVTPGMPSNVYVSREWATAHFGEAATRFEERKRGFALVSFKLATDAKVGPVRVKGAARIASIGLDGHAAKARVQWFETEAYRFADALAGPDALPAPVVRFHLRAPRAGETSVTLPLAPRRWWLATTPRRFDGKEVRFAFAPHFPISVASAAAGAAIASDLGGTLGGETQHVRISHGVERPVRRMALARPLAFGATPLDALLVRTRDYGDASTIAAGAEDDPSESGGDVLVTGKRKGTPPSYVVYLGADALRGCSSITYDKVAATVTLSCMSGDTPAR